MAKKVTTKKAAPKKTVGKSKSKGVPPAKEAKKAKPQTLSMYDIAFSKGFDFGKEIGAANQVLENFMNKLAPDPKVTARLSFELDEANDCKINISGDFNVILKKMHEIQNQSITVDKGEFFSVAAQLMKGEK